MHKILLDVTRKLEKLTTTHEQTSETQQAKDTQRSEEELGAEVKAPEWE
jgi:hypothetical protein